MFRISIYLQLKTTIAFSILTLFQLHSSAIDVSNIKDELEVIQKDSAGPLLPEGVEDYDSTCLDDIYSVAEYVGHIFEYYKEREVVILCSIDTFCIY